ncbi:ribosome silencing factor [Xenophilus arseniciresistens]|uniref:Ribosomal silencing factor RsfS n=1 Tax=Xenophilus arseniciresistens TaxID=1283306 RepID=A0AAE3T1P5_9BURK|nr:ribosome silencing factor [Xenophilus arseniciresistens]MDA7418191.1 ribosome silencing factor [Xenophilus arseniciresistens]
MSTEAAIKKDIQKLQRAIVDGLEDVKAQDIQVFNTEHLSPLFERVIVASGTSNRQTKALASSVRESVKNAGFAKPRIEGEDNGEWIIVDCGAAVAHIMQPNIRQYYHLEEIWGDKPIKLKLGAPAPVARKTSRHVASSADASEPKAAPRRKPAAKSAAGGAAAPARKKPAAKSAAAGSASAPAKKRKPAVPVAAKTVKVGKPATKPAAKAAAKPAARKTAARKPAAKKA